MKTRLSLGKRLFPPKTRPPFLAFLCLLCAIPAFLNAQSTAVEIETLLASEAVTYAQASRFVLDAAGVAAFAEGSDAFRFAMERNWLPSGASPDSPARLDSVSLLLLQAFGLRGGILFTIIESPHFAYRELEYLGFIPDRAVPNQGVSGDTLLYLSGRLLEHLEDDTPEPAEKPASEIAAEQDEADIQGLPPYAYDFGLILNQSRGVTRTGRDNAFDHETALVPRFFLPLDDYRELFVSASLKAAYQDEQWSVVPELLRSEFIWRFDSTDIRVGRMLYSDPMSIAASGLFDGARVSYHTSIGTFGVGIWYTGLLYRNRANISMTACDTAALQTEFRWGDFFNTYFASRRLLWALYWEHPSFKELLHLNAAFIAQADLNGRDTAHHNQYLIVKAVMPFGRFIFELGGALELAQLPGGSGNTFYFGLAGDIGVHWLAPTQFHSMVSFNGRFTSGRSETGGSRAAFTPVTTLPHGEILQAGISGLSVLSARYSARLYRTFSAAVSLSCFIRSDTETYAAYPLDGQFSSNQFLGTELFTRFIWSPFSDISLNLGAGVFLPALGNVAPNADPRWRAELAATAALR